MSDRGHQPAGPLPGSPPGRPPGPPPDPAACPPPSPPPGYTVRAPRLEDAQAVATLKRAASEGRRESEETSDTVLQMWSLPRLELGRDAWLVSAPDGAPAASAFVFEDAPARFQRVHAVHPGHEGHGLEEYLLDAAEGRVRERLATTPARAGTLTVVAFESEPHHLRLYESRDYAQVRVFLRLHASLEAVPEAAQAPAGLGMRPFRRERDERVVYEALQEAFLDHWEPTDLTFEEWLRLDYGAPGVDPALWRVAWDGDEVAGVVLASASGTSGWVDDLGVRRPWRGRGLGRALLLEALAALHRRGVRDAYLGVDAVNPTGALQLYTSAGMRQIGEQHLVFQKELAAS